MNSEPTYTVAEDGCWVWTGRKNPQGYGRWGAELAHRRMYLAHKGGIPAGYEVDHLCRRAICVNPDHLEPVTPEENRRRKYSAITQCVNGHPYDDENTYVRPNGQRDCRVCIRRRVAAYKRRKFSGGAA